MALKFYKLYKIDRANDTALVESFENTENIESYVIQVIEKHRSKYEREYIFRSGEETAKNNVMRILQEEALMTPVKLWQIAFWKKKEWRMTASNIWGVKYQQVCLSLSKTM